jgi:hypothetical protein
MVLVDRVYRVVDGRVHDGKLWVDAPEAGCAFGVLTIIRRVRFQSTTGLMD